MTEPNSQPPTADTVPLPALSQAEAHGTLQQPVPAQSPAGVAAYAGTPAAMVNVYQQNYAPAPPQTLVLKNAGPGILVRTAWYVFVGWWLSGLVMFLAALCILSVVALPLGLALVNRLPAVMTLRPATKRITSAVNALGGIEMTLREAEQRPMLHRTVYFVLIGWWASLAAMTVAWFLSVTVIGLPLALMVLNRLPEVTTLRRN